MKKKVIIDCDPGIDDALAILLALTSGELEVNAITTVRGNVGVKQTTKNLLSIVEIAKVKNPPATGCGSSVPLRRSILPALRLRSSRRVHGNDGLGNSGLSHPTISLTHKDGIELIISKLISGEADTLICLGPLTNIARALILKPELKNIIAKIIVMGGAVFCPGNVTPDAEFNIFSDPEAADVVFSSGLTIDLVSLDVTKKAILNQIHLQRLKDSSGQLRDFIVGILEYSIKFHQSKRKVDGTYLHDPLAVGIALDESLGNFQPLSLGVDLSSRRGKTYIKDGPPNVRFCSEIDAVRFMDIFLDRLTIAIERANRA